MVSKLAKGQPKSLSLANLAAQGEAQPSQPSTAIELLNTGRSGKGDSHMGGGYATTRFVVLEPFEKARKLIYPTFSTKDSRYPSIRAEPVWSDPEGAGHRVAAHANSTILHRLADSAFTAGAG